jgi:hypothetical protein
LGVKGREPIFEIKEKSMSKANFERRIVLCWIVCLYIGLAFTSPAETPKEGEPSKLLLSALAKLGYLDSGRTTNTFYIPRTPTDAEGTSYVVYWKEKNVLFFFPADITAEAAVDPYLVRRHEYKVQADSFRRKGDADFATSTYLMTYDWAFERLIAAVVDGRKYELEYKPKAESK